MLGNKIGDTPYDFTLMNVINDTNYTLSDYNTIGNDKVILLSFIEFNTFIDTNNWGWMKHLVYIQNAIAANVQVMVIVFSSGDGNVVSPIDLSNTVDAYNAANPDYLINFPVLADRAWENTPATLDDYCVAQIYRLGFYSIVYGDFRDSWTDPPTYTGFVSDELWSYIIWNGQNAVWTDFKVMDKWHHLGSSSNHPAAFNRLRLRDSSSNIIQAIDEVLTDDIPASGIKTGQIDSSPLYTVADAVAFTSSGLDTTSNGTSDAFYNTQAFVIERINNLVIAPTILYTVPAESPPPYPIFPKFSRLRWSFPNRL